MKQRKLQVTIYDIMYEDKSTTMQSFTKMEFAAFKRTNRFKKVISLKKISQIEIIVKSLRN